MSVILAGKPDLSVGFLRHKILADQRESDKWNNRYNCCTSGIKSEVSESSSPPLPQPPTSSSSPSSLNSNNNSNKNGQGCGMCARSQAATTTCCAMTTATTTTVTTADVQRTAQEPSVVNDSADHGVSATIMDVAIRCTSPGCNCEGFAPSKPHIRSCDNCHHGWVAHAMDKLGFRHLFNCHSVELVQATTVFDVASLMLYGTEAVPIRLKILLDRLFSVLQREKVIEVLHGFGWTWEDYTRGYILQDFRGQSLERWTMPSREEEPLILQQFLRFGETKPIAQQLLLQDAVDGHEHLLNSSREYSESDIKRFIQRTCRTSNSSHGTSLSTQHSAKTTIALPVTQTTTCGSLVSVTGSTTATIPSQVSRASRPPSSVSSTTSPSPTTASPMNSPLSSSPLNKLQNMQPYDFRRDRVSPDIRVQGLPLGLNFSHHHHHQHHHQVSTPLPSPTATMANSNYSLVSSAVTPSFMQSQHNNNNNSNSSRYNAMTSDLSMSATDEGSDNETDSGAINLSQHHQQHHDIGGHPHLDSIFAAKKIRHLRKSANPMKRRWNPMMLSAMTTNPATGKKRVQCHVCLKTFCDKGALKIHFSAVHLREMHKCTVDGCNMMFSSRRSRNRHSANPNPKLHTPNLRRKISHHDGRSSLPYPLIPSSTLINFNNGNGMMSLPSMMHTNMPPSEQDISSSSTRMIHTSSADSPNNKLDSNLPSSTVDDSSPDGGVKPIHSHSQSIRNSIDQVLQLTKKQRLELNGDASNDGDEGIDLSVKDDRAGVGSQSDSLLNKGVRKRKSFNPTKCTAASDDDLQYVSTDDSSSDTFVDDNGLLSKSDEFSSDLLEDDSKDDDLDKDSNSVPAKPLEQTPPSSSSPDKVKREITAPPVQTSPKFISNDRPDIHTTNAMSFSNNFRAENLASKEREPVTLDLSSKHREPVVKSERLENEEISESPLRHLETLSLGAFTGLLNHTKSTFSHHMSSTTSTGISYHAPGLGLASSGSSVSDLQPREKNLRVPSTEPQPLPMAITSSGMPVGAPDSDQDGQMQMLPMYRDASMMSGIDVPVDKENPRRCIACGKIFQNHFGVKTHYQNVHLKLMHKCTVEGCNAAFPSKRSRDRHSANLNLHRKLLSTSVDKAHYFDKGTTIFPYGHPQAMRDDYFSRLYDPQSLPLNFADFYHSRLQEGFLPSAPFGGPLGIPGPLGIMPGFHPAFMVPPTSASNSSLNEGGTAISDGRDDTPLSSISSTPSPRLHSPSSPSSSGKDRPTRSGGRQPLSLESDLVPDDDGRYPCNFCQRLFGDAYHLKDHYEGTHLPSLVPCPLESCYKVFLNKPDKDKHCADEGHCIQRVKREPSDS